MIAPRIAQVLRQRGVVRRDEIHERQRPAGGRQIGGLDVVLQRDRNAVQRSANLSGRALAIALVRFLQRIRIDGDRRVQLVLIRGDADEVLQHELVRGDAPVFQRGLHVGDAGLDDVERFAASVSSQRRR